MSSRAKPAQSRSADCCGISKKSRRSAAAHKNKNTHIRSAEAPAAAFLFRLYARAKLFCPHGTKACEKRYADRRTAVNIRQQSAVRHKARVIIKKQSICTQRKRSRRKDADSCQNKRQFHFLIHISYTAHTLWAFLSSIHSPSEFAAHRFTVFCFSTFRLR